MAYLSSTSINISMLSISLIFTTILFLGMLMQKTNAPTSKSLAILTGIEIAILVGQILQWILYGMALNGKGSYLTGRIETILFCIDFFLMYMSLIIFFKFLQIHIEDIAQRNSKDIKISDKFFKFFLLLGCVISLIFIITVVLHITVVYDSNGMTYSANPDLHLFLSRINTIIYITALFFIIKYRKILGAPYCLILLSYIISRYYVLPIDLKYNTVFTYIALSVEILILYLGIDRQRTIDLLSQQIEIARQQADLEEKNTQIMVSQIQPHFMYNTLSVIDYLCGKDPTLASTAINKFSDYLRANMKSIGSSTPISFEKELEHTKSYLWIEMLRFPDILEVEYDITVTDFRISPLTLQPLAENAVKHGIRGNEDGGKIIISTRLINGDIYICVEDNGIGFDPSIKPDDGKLHVGIENVRSRIHAICNGSLEIKSTPGKGTTATIIIPKSEDM